MLTLLVAATAIGFPAEAPFEEAAHSYRGIALLKPAPSDGYLVVVKDAGQTWDFGLEQVGFSADEILRSAILFYLGFEDHTYSVFLDRPDARVKGGESPNFDYFVNGQKDETQFALNGFGLHEAY